MKFVVGDRVRVSAQYHWARQALGTVVMPPEAVRSIADTPWDGPRRFVKGVRGPIEFYWIAFDESRRDADGDGPYDAAEVEAEHLEPAS